MRAFRKIILVLIGVVTMFSLSGCGAQKYKVNYDGYGFESKRTSYAAGEKVTVYYGMIATDTDYNFYIDDDVDMKQSYDNDHGYIFTFTMPAHDVTLHEESHNSMMYIPEPEEIEPLPEDEIAAELDESAMLFDYYDAVVATVGGDGYDELVLYDRQGNPGLILAKYSKWGEGGETRKLCLVPESVLEDCMDAVSRHDMRNWKDGFPITGAFYVVKFKDGESTVRITSETMPEDGQAAFDEIAGILGSAWGQYGPRESSSGPKPSPTVESGPPAEPEAAEEDPPGADGQEPTWFCPECGRRNSGNVCLECGYQKPVIS